MPSHLRALALMIAVATAMLPPTAGAAERRDHDAARRAVQAGEIRPLAEILAQIRDKLPGEVVGVEVERRNDRWLYELRTVDRAGRLFEVHVDGNSGSIERVREK